MNNIIELHHGKLHPLTEVTAGAYRTPSGRTIITPHTKTISSRDGVVASEAFTFYKGKPYLYVRSID